MKTIYKYINYYLIKKNIFFEAQKKEKNIDINIYKKTILNNYFREF